MNRASATMETPTASSQAGLVRSLSLTHATLYGLGVTIGAGIYVLIGAAAARAGMHAPLAFAAAAALMALSAASFAELAGRFPVAAGEAAYARAAFHSNGFATAVGLLVVAIAVVSAAAIAVGSAGYIALLVPLPTSATIAGVIVAMGAVTAWGVKQSVTFAGAMTILEIGGLLLLLLAGAISDAPIVSRLPEIIPSEASPALLAGLIGTTLLAVFAFIGFEGLANVAEEVREPERTLPRAIFLTLAISTFLYVAVVWVALVAASPAELAQSDAPLALAFERLAGAPSITMSLIAAVATLNGLIVQIILASRVLYGVARQGGLPAILARVSPRTRTPIVATGLTTACVLVLALIFPLTHLADITSRLTLVVFAIVNISLVRLKQRGSAPPAGTYIAPPWVPWAGAATCIGLLLLDLLVMWR